jgi:hypothetical protein
MPKFILPMDEGCLAKPRRARVREVGLVTTGCVSAPRPLFSLQREVVKVRSGSRREFDGLLLHERGDAARSRA